MGRGIKREDSALDNERGAGGIKREGSALDYERGAGD